MDNCTGKLAGFIAKHGHDLWQIDMGTDDCCLAIMPKSQKAKFRKEWTDKCESVELIAHDEKPSVLPAKNKKIQWLEKKHDFPEELSIQAEDYSFNGICFSFLINDTKDKSVRTVDFNHWPPVVEKFPLIGAEKSHWEKHQLVYCDDGQKIWLKKSSSYQFLSSSKKGYEKIGPAVGKSMDNREVLVNGGIIYAVFSTFNKTSGNVRSRVLRISGELSDVIFETNGNLTICDIGQGRILISESNIMTSSWDSTRFWIWNEADKSQILTAATLPTMPCQIKNALAYLGDDEILYFSKKWHPAQAGKGFRETVLHAHRFNFTTLKETSFALEGFCSTTTYKPGMFNSGEIDLIVKSFEGHVSISKGHGDCWILRYLARISGSKTLFWIWNQSTNETLKVTSKEIPKTDFPVFYSKKLDRYFSYTSTAAIILAPFDKMLSAAK